MKIHKFFLANLGELIGNWPKNTLKSYKFYGRIFGPYSIYFCTKFLTTLHGTSYTTPCSTDDKFPPSKVCLFFLPKNGGRSTQQPSTQQQQLAGVLAVLCVCMPNCIHTRVVHIWFYLLDTKWWLPTRWWWEKSLSHEPKNRTGNIFTIYNLPSSFCCATLY